MSTNSTVKELLPERGVPPTAFSAKTSKTTAIRYKKPIRRHHKAVYRQTQSKLTRQADHHCGECKHDWTDLADHYCPCSHGDVRSIMDCYFPCGHTFEEGDDHWCPGSDSLSSEDSSNETITAPRMQTAEASSGSLGQHKTGVRKAEWWGDERL